MKDLKESNVEDVIIFTQPPTYQGAFSDEMNVSGVHPNSFPEAARRVIASARNQSTVYPKIRKDDLQPFLQLAILVLL